MTFRAACAAAFLLVSATNLGAQAAVSTAHAVADRQRRSIGEVAAVEEANEVRVVFSEPMVALGRVPARVRPSFFHISPAVAGTFRWSGTTILIFTPARKAAAAGHEVRRHDRRRRRRGQRPEAGRAVHLHVHDTDGAGCCRPTGTGRGGRFDRPPMVVLRFNQPVKPEDVAAHLAAALRAASVRRRRVLAGGDRAAAGQSIRTRCRRSTPRSRRARAAASATASVPSALPKDWDKKRFPPAPDMVVLERRPPCRPRAGCGWQSTAACRRSAGLAVSGRRRHYTIKVEPAFFVNGFDCRAAVRSRTRQPDRPCACR